MIGMLLIVLCLCAPFFAAVFLLHRKDRHSRTVTEEVVEDMHKRFEITMHLERYFGLSKKSACDLITDLLSEVRDDLDHMQNHTSNNSDLIDQMTHLEYHIIEYLITLKEV